MKAINVEFITRKVLENLLPYVSGKLTGKFRATLEMDLRDGGIGPSTFECSFKEGLTVTEEKK